MLIPRVARRYAEAVYDSIPPDPGIDAVMRDVDDLRGSLNGSRELRSFFRSPVIPFSKKTETLNALFGDRLGDFMLRVLHFLLDKRREGLLAEILEAMTELDARRKGLLRATVSAARELDDASRRSLVEALDGITGLHVQPEYRVEKELLGGLVVRVGDIVYDGSVRRSLELLRLKLMAGTA
jgi:F-type H+-transporting ATPase subunit delta